MGVRARQLARRGADPLLREDAPPRIAQRRDVSPGRVLSDAALVALAVEPPKDAGAFAARRELRGVARSPKVWLDAIDKALAKRLERGSMVDFCADCTMAHRAAMQARSLCNPSHELALSDEVTS